MTNAMTWVTIPAGKIQLSKGGYLPQDTTCDVAPFAITRYPVTNLQFTAFMRANGYAKQRWWTEDGWALRTKWGWDEPRHWYNEEWTRPGHPAVGVSWYEALAFCRWLSHETGQTITLPTEQQWQRAAQGDDGRPFPWGDEEPDATRCNWQRTVDGTTPVTAYPAGASPYGVMDMSGNVWEWCRTGWETGTTAANGDARMLRGGSWSSDSPFSLQVTNRSALDPNTRLDPGYRNHVTVGFRCVRLE